MNTLIPIIFFVSFLFLTTSLAGQEKVNICGEDHYHPVDIKEMKLADSLKSVGVDSFLFYRHWLGMNGFNGYGKLIWKQYGNVYQYQIDFKNDINDYGIKSVTLSKLRDDSIFVYYFTNRLDTITTNPQKRPISWIDHDSEHFVYLSVANKVYCFTLLGELLWNNPEHFRSQFIFRLIKKNNR
jgi:hypothetical protein